MALGSLGRRLPRGGNLFVGGLVAGAGMYGFAKGVGSQNVSDNLQEFTTGDPQIDQYAIGTDMSVGGMIAYPMVNPTSGMVAGGAAGAGLGALATRGKSMRVRLAAGIIGASFGVGLGRAAGSSPTAGLPINSTTISDALRGRRYNNTLPRTDGGMVFGMYNSRMGGY